MKKFIKRYIFEIIIVILLIIYMISHIIDISGYDEDAIIVSILFGTNILLIINFGIKLHKKKHIEIIWMALVYVILFFVFKDAFRAMSFFFISLFSIPLAVILFIRYGKKQFLSIISLCCFLTYSICLFGLMNFRGVEVVLDIGAILFIVVSLAIIFIFPNSNFPQWTKEHKQFFLKGIIIPWILLFAILTVTYIFPEIFRGQQESYAIKYWKLKDYEVEMPK